LTMCLPGVNLFAMTNLAERRLTPQMRLVEVRHGRPIETLLRGLRKDGLTTADIARRVGVPYGTVYRWLALFGLDDGTLIRQGLAGNTGAEGGS
jgi:Homeodomain-like domain